MGWAGAGVGSTAIAMPAEIKNAAKMIVSVRK